MTNEYEGKSAGELAALRQERYAETTAWLEQRTVAQADGNKAYKLTDAERTELNNRNDDLNALGAAYDRAAADERTAKSIQEQALRLAQPRDEVPFAAAVPVPGRASAGIKSLGELAVETPEFKSWAASKPSSANFGFDLPLNLTQSLKRAGHLKTTLSDVGSADGDLGNAGWPPFSPRTGDVVPFAVTPLVVADLIPESITDYASVVYMQQTLYDNEAAFVAESTGSGTGDKPESALGWTQVTVPIEFVAHLLPVTRQQLEDVPGIQQQINEDMVYMLRLIEQSALLNGNGTSPNIQGFLSASGVQTQAKSTDPIPTAIMKAFTKVRWTGYAEPSGVIQHPTDYLSLVTLQDTLGRYIFGDPSSITGISRIWGVPIVVTNSIVQGTLLTGDFGHYARIWRKGGLRIDISDSHNDTFGRNVYTVRVEERLALVIRRASAFCTVTGQ